MIKKVNYKLKKDLYKDLKVGDTFRYIKQDDCEIIYMSQVGPISLTTGDLITVFDEGDEVIKFDITINIE